MEVLLFLFLFLFSAVLILLNKYTENGELFLIASGVILVAIALPLITEGITFNTPTEKVYNQSFVYDPATLTPTNSTVSVTYTNLNQNDIYTNGLGGMFFLLGSYVMYTGGLTLRNKRNESETEEV